MKKSALIFLLALFALPVLAQKTGFSGVVAEKKSGAPVEYATVLVEATGQWAVTDAQGRFTIQAVSVPKSTVSIASLGYVTLEQVLDFGQLKEPVSFLLEEDNLTLNGAVVTAKENEASATTSRTIDKTALEHVQLMNVSSIASLLPGGVTLDNNPISSREFSIRAGTSAAEGNPSFGTAVEVDGVRLFTQQVSSPKFGASNTVNVINQECIINTPGDTYIGYGIVGSNIDQPLLVTTSTEENVGYIGLFETDKAVSWNTMEIESAYYTPLLSASVGDVVAPDMGFNYIANPGNGVYTAGERFSLTVVETEYDVPQGITWYYDGILTQADSVSLTAGTHQIEARLRFSDGTTERIYLTIQVQ